MAISTMDIRESIRKAWHNEPDKATIQARYLRFYTNEMLRNPSQNDDYRFLLANILALFDDLEKITETKR